MKNCLVILFAYLIGLQSCSTDFEVNAPWKDITVVYGLLNQNEKPHVIKINKAFLGEADVNDMAAIADSSEYAADEVTITIERSKNGAPPDAVFALTRYIDTTKPAGTFYSPDQVLYRFSDTLLPNYDYKLVVLNNKTDKRVTAETKLIKDFKFASKSFWNALAPKVGFYNNGNYFPFTHALWNSAENGRRYQLTVRFYYTEIDQDNGQVTEKFVDWIFPTTKAPDLDGGDEMGNDINGEDFYKFIANKLEPTSASNNVVRCIGRGAVVGDHLAGHFDFIVDVAGEDFNTYLEVNEPSTGIVQERPEYTNVFDENGNDQAGFFSARYSIYEEGAQLSSSGINGNSITELKSGVYTSGYGFITKVDLGTCPL